MNYVHDYDIRHSFHYICLPLKTNGGQKKVFLRRSNLIYVNRSGQQT